MKKPKLKVGVLIDRIIVGGVEKTAIEEVRGLSAMGVDATLLVLAKTQPPKVAFSDALGSIRIVYLDQRLPKFLRFSFKIPFFTFFSLFHLTYPFFMPFVVRRQEYDFIVSHNSYTTFTAHSLSLSRRIPYGFYVHDPAQYLLTKAYTSGPIKHASAFLGVLARWVDKRLASSAKVVFTPSDIHAKYLAVLSGNPNKIVRLIPGYQARSHLPKATKEYFLAITAWKHGKQLEKLLPIIRDLPGARLEVAGKWVHDDYRQSIDRLVDRLGIADRITIRGEVSESELASLYLGAIAAIIVNDEKGFGMPGMEAAGNGTTFVAPDDCGISSLFDPDREAYFFPTGDLAAAGAKIAELHSTPGRARAMGENAWHTVVADYSWHRHCQNIMAAVLPDPSAPMRAVQE